MRETPEFPALSGLSYKLSHTSGLPGWRRSADRTCLREDSLQTGNFTGILSIFADREPTAHQKTLQRSAF